MTSAFEEKIKNPTSPIAIDISSNSPILLVAFGGIIGALGMPPFEFFNITRNIETKKIYIRDLNQVWYHQGLKDVAADINGIAILLKDMIAKMKPERVVMVGNSMGGYASILFGSLLNVNAVHAFAPQTFIDRRNRLLSRDFRWKQQIRKTNRIGNKDFFDLKRLLITNNALDINIYYSTFHRLDRIHAERLKNMKGVKLHIVTEEGHGIVKHLRDTGMLKKILISSLNH